MRQSKFGLDRNSKSETSLFLKQIICRIQVTELLRALSETIGISPDTFSELDLEQLVKVTNKKLAKVFIFFQDAIMVKEGKLDRIPQCYIFLEGIWPPALVPLFMRDGSFPDFVN